MTANIQEKSITIVTGAFADSDYGDGPEFAYTDVDQKFLALVEKLVQLCKEHQLNEVRYSFHPTWGPGDIDTELRLQNGELVATANGGFWFTDYPKHGNYCIQSRAQDVEELSEVFLVAEHGATVFLTDDDSVRERYEEHLSDTEEDEATAESADN